MESKTCSITSSWPTITLLISLRSSPYFETSCETAFTSDILNSSIQLIFQPVCGKIAILIVLVHLDVGCYDNFILPRIDYFYLFFPKCKLFDPFIILYVIGHVFWISFGCCQYFQQTFPCSVPICNNPRNFSFLKIIYLCSKCWV